jgi:2-polyprenyl-3-methyl-5-hydroxy-6-metoxy-1,4-benzoquinol methylase
MTATAFGVTTIETDQNKAEAFADQIANVLNNGALSIALSIGHRTGLFDTLATMPPATSVEIAETANLNERYVREWLGAMVTGGVITYDIESKTYQLPQEHAASLTRAASPDNMAVFAQYIPMMGQVEDPIVNCFHRGGGVPYSAYPRFHQIMAEESGQTVVAALVDMILPLVPGLPEQLESGIDVMDLGCGAGRAMNLMAKTYPNSRFTGLDMSDEAVNVALHDAKAAGLDNVTFEVVEGSTVAQTGPFDLITAFDAIHDQAKPAQVLAGIGAALRPDGIFLMQDIAGSSHVHNNADHPIGPFLYTLSMMHCMTVSLAQDGPGLGAMWGEELALEMLAEAGFDTVTVRQLPHDIQNNYFIATKS